ncbi:MAG: 3-isopropylmalate dehydratase small subunit [Candidatus Omnitrophica bacterium]|nr:3-isopropylmalate dehydratase small subunit [Candidatus Omnitrophota bacterium]MDE2009342.1 3-isopropylmalate dehydratase small subunit [Candidatus Omnitrophota bacterium]MDE2214126.1 3-isopropylmalate dehydratase small subunit [Candidatus Omnitrophota bacterium]MDE2231163.1 3-isopropylmalate dehydratase small subunit [Candidatus Omnitrophota bacterium]
MQPFKTHTGVAAPLDRVNVDTDAIIPKQFLRKIEKAGFGRHLFHEWRYSDYEGTKENPDFVLNQGPFRKATVLLARDNFGCGSSREHAPWALADFGFKVIIAPSFADIFYNNCVKNGILLARLKSQEVDEIFAFAAKNEGGAVSADLPSQTVTAGGRVYKFPMDAFNKECLLKGLDAIGWTMQFKDNISDYENKMKSERPWISRV